MSDYLKLTTESELPPVNEAREFSIGDKTVCVANVDGTITAMDNICLHRGGPLGQGVIDRGKVICPWHGWEWNASSGEAAHNPAVKVPVYALKIENGDVLIKL
jgi:nitrite reductase (NADH) small subunit